MIELVKLEKSDFEVFKSWIKNQDELIQFAGSIFNFPLTDEQLIRYITDNRRIVYKVMSLDTNSIIGNAELNFENPLPRLSRVLIGDIENRNKGFGGLIINKMLERLFNELNFEEADLNVFDWNKAAIKCYENVGFTINPDISYKHDINGKIWTAVNMKITKDKWLKISMIKNNVSN
jgi:RimJ/RimL family protein N-acetyltransferase